ncbi:hypothetical protein LTSEALA_5344 [Salmonella enterica subsp. enterica serovar Alachua str. R6-377]|uniref:Uncharacterized protein n=1 Tax=Salmonella enterica subsp. enterica serovar Alachua str. R6-377 TaxID=913241 RepID=G5LVL1_SALET|nr:hypothetical protein LTSEALA_5344 [Salmonella enterica subsp. enterica serovar Alachua str. R6-377]
MSVTVITLISRVITMSAAIAISRIRQHRRNAQGKRNQRRQDGG